MALALAGWTVSVTLTDLGGNKATMRHQLPSTVVYADAASAATALVAALADVTAADITGYNLTARYTDAAVSGDGEVSGQALLVVETDEGKKAVMRIPAPEDSIFVGPSGPSYNQVDVNDSDLLTYLALFSTGPFEISDGEKFDKLLEGKRMHRATNEG
jgi:hypothetical protein